MRIRRSRGLVAALTAAVLVAAGATPAVAEDDPPWTTVPGTEADVAGLQVSFETQLRTTDPWSIGEAYAVPVPALRPTAVNTSEEVRWVGLALDIDVAGETEPLWDASSWGALSDLGPDLFDEFWTELAPGESLVDELGLAASGAPSWPGRTFQLLELSGPPETEPTSVVVAQAQDPGRFVPMDLDVLTEEQGIPAVGQALEIAATGTESDLFPGVAATVQASGLVAGEELELWLAPGFDYFFLFLLGGGLPLDAVRIGAGAVAADGTLTADVVLPHDVALGRYQLVAGDPVERYWPAGSRADFVITQPAAAGSGATPTDGSPLTIPFGPTSVTFAFPSGTSAGTTTAAVTATGPSPVGFTLASDPPLYYHLSTTSTAAGPVQVCIDYDTTALPGDPPRLYHHVPAAGGGYAWVDITTSRTLGRVCGAADGFSPFVLGRPPHDGSTTPPARAVLSDDNGHDTGLEDGDYTVSVDLWWGENASAVRLLEDGVVVAQQGLVRDSPRAQHASFPIAGRGNGAYVYTAELSNSTGTTTTSPLTVRVTDANPGRPRLTATQPRAGAFTLTASLGWGTNATSAQFTEDGVPIGAPIPMTARTPDAQSVSIALTRPRGEHVYAVAFSNGAGTTWSATIRVKVK